MLAHRLLHATPFRVIFAADMRGKARGRWVEETIAIMLQSNKLAAEVFSAHRANACTDVTGFGLAGHLVEMCGSDARVVLDIERIPVVSGALELARQKIVSSLFEANKQHFESAISHFGAENHANFPLLFDPQTSGGLLAAVPKDQAESCIASLHASGYVHATAIGRVTAQESGLGTISLVAEH